MEQLIIEVPPDLYYLLRGIAHQEDESISVVICQLLYSSIEYNEIQAQIARLANQLRVAETPHKNIIKLNGRIKHPTNK